jgi:hypothetical protein
LATKVTVKVIRCFFCQKIRVESYPLPKKSIENKHGKIHPWTQTHHGHGHEQAKGHNNQGQGYKWIGKGLIGNRDTHEQGLGQRRIGTGT